MLVADRDLARQDLPVQVSLLGWEKEVVLAVLKDWASDQGGVLSPDSQCLQAQAAEKGAVRGVDLV